MKHAIAFTRAAQGQVTNRMALELADGLEHITRCTRRMLVALDHYWDAYEVDNDRMLLWWNAYERERAEVETFLTERAE